MSLIPSTLHAATRFSSRRLLTTNLKQSAAILSSLEPPSIRRRNIYNRDATGNMVRHRFSTESSQGGIRGWMENRRTKKEQEQYMEQMERLSNMEELTLENYKGELERGLDSWGAKLTLGQTKEIKLAKEVVDCIGCFIEVLGKSAKIDDLINMDRLQRLKVATSSNKSVEDIQIMITQVQNMDLMQRTLRKRKLEGKPIPPDSQSMQAAIRKDALAVMTKTQKEMMKKRQQEVGRRMARKRR